ncbi:hypothetical protein PISMIDRAFT_671159 [Pisolithus microcarpus 441]|uniref:Uncharacterized protein n=1 Tax=Pisolithus microcarpus 441 TaxID=765257 RepID=A0A0D0ADH5_9AGAM|nr:hypothetical protein PISMIDRAFT_671159 [Pisolithus microcarpus 441]
MSYAERKVIESKTSVLLFKKCLKERQGLAFTYLCIEGIRISRNSRQNQEHYYLPRLVHNE